MKPQLSAAVLTALCLTAAVVCACGSPAAQSGQQQQDRHETASATAAPVASEAPCTARDLGARFHGGGYGSGNDFGSIQIWNSGSAPCQLDGKVRFTALYANGSRDSGARLNKPLPPLTTILPAAMTRPAEQADLSAYLVAQLMGPERDDPQQPNGLCRDADKVAPATLILSIGSLNFRVTNLDPDTPAIQGNSRAVYGCHGQVLLEGITSPDHP